MTTTTKSYLFLILILVLLSSCGTNYYYPTFQEVPTNLKKNEIKGSYFMSADNQGFNVSYTPANSLGVFLCMNTFSEYDLKYGTQMVDFGLYYFKNKSITDNTRITYSISSAYGFGQINGSELLDINRIFIQPSVAITSKFIDFGLSSRFSYVDYHFNRRDNQPIYGSYDYLKDVGNKAFYFFEPHLFLGLGYKGIKLNYHLVKVNKMNDAQILYYDESVGYFSLSLKLNVEKLFK